MRWLILSITALLVLALVGVRSSETGKDWRKAALDKENEYRALHGMEPRALEKTLNEAAQIWADRLSKECAEYHYTKEGVTFASPEDKDIHYWHVKTEGDRRVGENLAGIQNSDPETAALKSVGMWYSEIERYPFPKFCGQPGVDCSKEKLGGGVGHFTQMIWKDSKFAGYGFAHNPACKYKTHVVARYFPSGNYKGEDPDNVTPPLKKSS